jgi:NAD-dependent DNA ligase
VQKQQEKTDKERFVELSWWIIEQKVKYYHLGWLGVSDEYYDKLEAEYKALAKKLNLNPNASNTVGCDFNKPSFRLVLSKLLTEGRDGKGSSL